MKETLRPKILLVDDRQDNLTGLIAVLADFNIEILTAISGNDALKLSLIHEFALILLDVQMPVMNGFKTAEILRTRIDTPIIFVTAYGSDLKKIVTGYQSGAVDYLVKPLDVDILKAKVSVFLSLYQQKKSLESLNLELQQEIQRKDVAEQELTLVKASLEDEVQKRTDELKRSNDQLQQSEEQTRLILNSIPAMVALVSDDLQVEYASQRFVDILGDPGEKKLGEVLDKNVLSSLKSRLPEILKGKHIQFEGEISISPQKKISIRVDGIPHSKDLDRKGVILLMQDISDQKEEEGRRFQLERQQRQIQKLKALSTLAGGIAHELNNMLVPILGFSKMVLNTLSRDSKEASYLERVVKTAYRAEAIVSQVKTFSRKREIAFEPLDLQEVLKLANITGIHSSSQTIELKIVFHEQLPKVRGNLSQLVQLINNLYTNSIEAIPDKGEVVIEVLEKSPDHLKQLDTFAKDHRWVCLRVKDTGCGIDNKAQDQVFNPFFSTKEKSIHTGLGLSVALNIVDQHDGYIEIAESNHQGTQIDIYFPGCVETEDKGPDVSEENSSESGRLSILYIEGEELTLELSRVSLETDGFKVYGDNNGSSALQKFTENPDGYDIIITSQTIKGLPALSLVENFRSIRPDIAIVLCLGHAEETEVNQYKQAGVNETIRKPYEFEDLKYLIHKLTGR